MYVIDFYEKIEKQFKMYLQFKFKNILNVQYFKKLQKFYFKIH